MSWQRVPFTVEIRIIYELADELMMNTYHADRGLAYSQGELDSLAGVIDVGPARGMLADQSVHCTYVRTDVKGLNAENDMTSTANTWSDTGGVADQALPRHESFVITRRSLLSGRSARGRVFTLGIPWEALATGEPDNSKLTAAYADANLAHVDAFRSSIDGTGLWEPVIVSRYNDKVKRAEGITFIWASSDYMTLKLGTQKKRLNRFT